ncbi:MAG: hypothetical protein V7746_12190 [Halioglobus sp.]
MWGVVFLFGVFVCIASLALQFRLAWAEAILERVFDSRWIYLAALFRLLLGAALIASAQTVKYPGVITLIGWLLAFGGIILVVVPQDTWVNMGRRMLALPSLVLRGWLLIGLAFGAGIVYVALA